MNKVKVMLISVLCVVEVAAMFLMWKSFSGGGTFYQQ